MHRTLLPQLDPPERILLGPGPSTVPERILKAMAAPTVGHLDPSYIDIMDETCELLRQVFQTTNQLTFAVSGTGSAGMECCLVNLVEPGDEIIVCINGVFGGRMKEVAERSGATVHTVELPWGEVFSAGAIIDALTAHPSATLLGIVHAETSTGAHQPLEEISRAVHHAGMLFLVDTVTSLAGHEVRVDDWGIDAVYSGTQKCLSCPPGLSPVSFSQRALERMDARKSHVQSWYLDVSMLRNYYGGAKRVYHHTAPINMTYALREALLIVLEEGLDTRVQRHRENHEHLRAGLEKLGISYIPENSLCSLNAVHTPDGIDEANVRRRLLEEYNIEIGAGLGPFAGKAWRIGIMGHASTRANVELFLAALGSVLD
ncbi:MAG: alanine--glyoxylate aminotransferase family protein [Verrucomicrobiota bacterium]